MRHVAFLRGVNVGGHRTLKMADFRTALEGAGLRSVKTYIQSGNVLLDAEDADTARAQIERVLRETFALDDVPLVVLSVAELAGVEAACPFAGDPARIIAYLCHETPAIPEAVSTLDWPNGPPRAVGRAVYAHEPDGTGQSRRIPKLVAGLPPEATGRNMKTIATLLAMA